LALIIDTVGAGAAARDFDRLAASASGLGKATGKTAGMLDGLASKAGISAGALKGGLVTGAVAAAGALVKFGADSVGAFTDLAAEVRSVQRAMGGTAEDASRLVAAGDDMGVSAETLAKSMFQLARRTGEAGVEVARTKNGHVDMAATLLNVADAYQATKDPAQRAKLVNDAFGRSGAAMIPILEQTREGIRRMYAEAAASGQLYSDEDLDKAEELRLAQDALADAAGELSLAVGRGLTPAMTDLALAATAVVDALNAIPEKGKGMWESIADGLGPVGDVLEMIGVGNPMPWIREVGVDSREAASGLGEMVDPLDELLKVTMASTSAQRALEAASRGLESSQRRLGDAQADLNELLAEGAVDEEKVADARRSLADATRSAAAAGRNLAKAQREYDEALAAAAALGMSDTAVEELADASDNLADAKDSSASAHERETEAAEKLAEATRGDPEFADKLAKARLAVADATQGVADAEYNLGQRSYEAAAAHDAEATAIAGKAGAVKALRGELELLLDLNPEQAAFLGPLLGAVTPPDFGHPPAAGAVGTTTTASTSVTFNNVIEHPVDPILIARNFMWQLTG
jgi:hypothetical protein